MDLMLRIRDKISNHEEITKEEWAEALEKEPALGAVLQKLENEQQASEPTQEEEEEEENRVVENSEEEEEYEELETNEQLIEDEQKKRKRETPYVYIHGVTMNDCKKHKSADMAHSRVQDIYKHLELRQLKRTMEEKEDEILLQEIVYLRQFI